MRIFFCVAMIMSGLLLTDLKSMENATHDSCKIPNGLELVSVNRKNFPLREKATYNFLLPDIIEKLESQRLVGVLGMLLIQWMESSESQNKIYPPFDMLLMIFRDVIDYYGGDLVYRTTFDMYPKQLTFCNPINDMLRKRYSVSNDLWNEKLNMWSMALLCQWCYGSPESLDKTLRRGFCGFPLEVLIKIFKYVDSKEYTYPLYLDEESGNALNARCLKTPDDSIIVELKRDYSKDLFWNLYLLITLNDSMPHVRKDLIGSFVSNVFSSLQSNELLSKSTHMKDVPPVEVAQNVFKQEIIHSNDELIYKGPLPFFPLLTGCYGLFLPLKYDNCYYDQGVVFFDLPKEKKLIRSFCRHKTSKETIFVSESFHEEYVMPGQHEKSRRDRRLDDQFTFKHVINVKIDNETLRQFRLPLLEKSVKNYHHSAPYVKARYNFVAPYDEFVILYDTETGQYPCMPIKKITKKHMSYGTPFCHNDKDFNETTKGIRPMVFDPAKERLVINKNSYRITRGGKRINCIAQ